MMEARYYERAPGGVGSVRCLLCPHGCLVADGGQGRCLARAGRGGRLVAESYGRVAGLALDPVEKKPLRRYCPGRTVLSVGSYGCNMRCAFCQNYAVSTARAPTESMPAERLLAIAREAAGTAGNIGIAFTYNEPLVGIEYVLDCAALFKEAGLRVVLVTNGLVNDAVLDDLLPWVDAMNIDLKSFDEDFYARHGGVLAPVKNTIIRAAQRCHVEVTTLIVPGGNDDPERMEEQAAWLAGLSPDIPLHLSRFFPRHRMQDRAPTPLRTLAQLEGIARAHLRHVYLGNV